MMAYQAYNVMYQASAGTPAVSASSTAAPTINPFMSYQEQAAIPTSSYPEYGQTYAYPTGSTFPTQETCYMTSGAVQTACPVQGAVQVPVVPGPLQQAHVYPTGPMSNGGAFPQLQQYPPPPTHQLPDKQFLWGVFQRVNRDKSGNISSSELQSALSNGTWKAFNPDTVRLMIGMFGFTTRNKVNFEEFCSLWKYVTDWLNYFQMFDQDCSGNIDKAELKVALMNFGYRLTDKFYKLLILKFDRDMKGAINFDDFIHCCVVLQALTTAFRSHDGDQDGWVRMTYEQFLMVVFRLKL